VKSETPPARSASWKWWITGLLLLATMINYMDRMTLANAAERITAELGLNNKDYGNLELGFGWAFAAGSLVFGFLADRLSVYFVYPAVLAAWSFTGMATGWSHGFSGLMVCRTLLGFFEAGHWPCAVKTTFALLSEKDRTMGNSVLQSGASVGAIITPQIMKLMLTAETGSWRTTFIAVGVVGLLWVVLWLACLRPRDLDRAPVARSKTDVSDLIGILRGGRFWAVALLLVGANIVWQIYRAWLPKFLQAGRGYGETAALNFNSLYFIATDVGCILAGVVSLWLIRRRTVSAHDARRTVYAGACVLTSLSIFIPWLGKGWPLFAMLLLIGAGALALFPCYYSFTQELSPTHVGRLTGLLSLWVWAVTSPMQPLFGMLADRTKSYDLGLVIAGLAPWIGVIAMKFLWRKNDAPASA
jgi:ACS family hexuronate transporter-like MFS transporter